MGTHFNYNWIYELNVILLFRNDSPTDKPKSFKWGFSKKFKSGDNGSKGMAGPIKAVETISLTEENIKQIYQLIDIISEDASA